MDRDRSGVLNIADIKGVYNGKKHPDVVQGKKTEEQVLGEFLDTFEAHYALNVSIVDINYFSMKILEMVRSHLMNGWNIITMSA